MNLTRSFRSAQGVRAMLLGALASTVFVGAYSVLTPHPGEAEPGARPVNHRADPAASFTTAGEGSCLNWTVNEDGVAMDFQQTSCAEPHRFEVSAREDLATYPSSEFGENAPRPDITRQAQLREELCRNVTLHYLDGKLDPSGRFSVASILPPADSWQKGDRTLLCGLQAADSSGTLLETKGKVDQVDQARVAQPGECLFVDSSNSLHKVECGADHHLETTQIVDLSAQFNDHAPTVEQQDEYLKDTCTQAAIGYLGEEEKLYQSTLQPFWSTISPDSWEGGSRSVNCSLVSAGEHGFNTLAGSATGEFTINGQPPAPQPKRNPLRSEAGQRP